MSVVSKDVVFHVKFDLEGAKKDLEKKHQPSSEPTHQQGSPHKIESQKKRGRSSAESSTANNLLSRQFAKEQVSKSLKQYAPAASHAPGPDPGDFWFKLISGPGGNKFANRRNEFDPNHWVGGGNKHGLNPSAEAVAAGRSGGKASGIVKPSASAVISKLKWKRLGLAAKEAEEASLGAMAASYGKSLLRFGKKISPAVALYELAKNSPGIAAGYAAAGLPFGSEIAGGLNQISHGISDAWLTLKKVVGKPLAYINYDADMAKQGRKGYAAGMGMLGGSNLGTIKYDMDQAQTRLTQAFDRCQAMQVGQSYANAYMETGYYKTVFGASARVCDAVGSLFRKR